MRFGSCSLNIFCSFVILLSSLKFAGLCAAKKEITKIIKKAIFIITIPHKMMSHGEHLTIIIKYHKI